MRYALALLVISACGDLRYVPTSDAADSGFAVPVSTTASDVVTGHVEWVAGACDPVRIPDGSIVQLIDCQDLPNGSSQCWPDAEQRLTLIGGTAYVLCNEDPESPDRYRLTWITAG